MKFKCSEMKIKSKLYKLYEVIEVPEQLRVIYSVNDRSSILGNAEAYDFLYKIFLIIGSHKEENSIFIVIDKSASDEKIIECYAGAEFHKNMMLFNFKRTQLTVKTFNRILKMREYVKSNLVDLRLPSYEFEKIDPWELDNALIVKNHGKWLLLSSNYEGYTYMSREALSFTDIEDDPEEFFAHAHLDKLTKLEDKLDLKYFYQEQRY